MTALAARRDRRVAHETSAQPRVLRGRRTMGTLASLTWVFILSVVLAAPASAASLDFFEPSSSPESVDVRPVSVAAADLDGDGDRDLATANQGSGSSLATITILKNDGTGDLFEPLSSPEPIAPNAAPMSIAVGDLDDDGDQDLVTGNANPNDSGYITFFKNDGTGDFVEPPSNPKWEVYSPNDLLLADIDGDGDQDLAAAPCCGPTGLTILKNNGSGQFFEPPSSPEPTPFRGYDDMAAADLDGDGDQDLAMTVAPNASFPGHLTILKNNGRGNYWVPVSGTKSIGYGFHPHLAATDLDGDGDQDLVASNDVSDDLWVFKNNGGGHFFEAFSSPEEAGINPESVFAADFDADGDPDLAISNGDTDSVTTLQNNGRGNFFEPASSPESADSAPISLAGGDLNADTYPDLAVANWATATLTILLNAHLP